MSTASLNVPRRSQGDALLDAARPTRSPGYAASGLLAGFVALFVLLLGSFVTGANGILEAIHNGVTAFIPLDLFETGIRTFGPYAKGLLFIGVAAAVPIAGSIIAVAQRRTGGLSGRPGLGDALFTAGLALLAGEFVVLPIFGAGFLGSSYRGDQLALHVPLALASAAYGLVLVGLLRSRTSPRSAADSPVEPRGAAVASPSLLPRRTFLGRSLAVVALGSAAGSILAVAGRVITAGSTNAAVQRRAQAPGGFGPTPVVTPVQDFYVVAKDLLPTTVDLASWKLRVSGLVDHPMSYTPEGLRAFTRVEGYRTLQCISNQVVVFGDLIGNQRWAGIRVRDVLAAAGVQAGATHVLWRSADGYTESIPVDVARDERTWLVDEMGPPGTPLTAEHGYPLRVLIAGRYGMKQPKYLTDIVLADHDEAGFWEQRTWDETAAVRTYSRIDDPQDGDNLPADTAFTVYGVASAGDRGIAKVELSSDGGSTWMPAELEVAVIGDSDLSWRRWRAQVTVPAGRAVLSVRATDGAGNVQDSIPRPPLPSGATGLHQIEVTLVPTASPSPSA